MQQRSLKNSLIVSLLLVPALAAAQRPSSPGSQSDRAVYRTVLDSLYSFHGERPGMVVIDSHRVSASGGVAGFSTRIDPTTIIGSSTRGAISDPIPAGIRLRIPVKFLTPEVKLALERDGPALERRAAEHPDGQESTPFWLAFRAHYPRAWGYVGLSRIRYNLNHTQALVYSSHRCGFRCHSGDTWLLTRTGERWSIAERVGREELADWYLDSLRYLGRGANPQWYKPGRARGVFRNVATGGVFRNLDVNVYHNERLYTKLRTGPDGSYSLATPTFGAIFWKTFCPGRHRDTLDAVDFQLARGMDTTLNVELDPRRCLRLARTHPWLAGALAAKPLPGSIVAPHVAAVYRGVLDFLFPGSDGASLLIQAHSRHVCDYCLEREVPRLMRKGMVKPATEADFIRATRESAPPPVFPYRRKLTVFPADDQEFLRRATDFWDVMKDAYPGYNAIVSFSRVGFDDQRTEALVEVAAEKRGEASRREVMLLRRSGAEWRVALGDVTRGATSGEWSGGKCEPTDAPAVGPSLAATRTLDGTYMIVRVHASRQARGATDTVWVRLSPLKPAARPRTGYSSEARVLDERGRDQPKIQGTLAASDRGANVTLQHRQPEGVIELDGWLAQHEIARVDQGGFYGSWSSQSGMTIPEQGHFCARKIAAR